MHDLQIFERESVNAATKTAVVSINEKTEVAALEKIVNTRTSFVRFIDYLQSFRNIGSQICRIEFPIDTPQGTGWLVAPDLVLTNYHVMEAILDGVHTSDDVICRFDYFSAQQGFGEKEYHLGAEDWCLDKSKYAQSDIGRSQADPTPDELDYILFRLKGEAGNDILPSGAKRGWIKVSENPVAILPGDIVVVPQHPRGRSLELAFGNVLSTGAYNSSGNRLRYDANTDHGSSGSPVFNIELKPFGLHHAGKVSGSTGYN
ncbi:MAG: serine protease, partial [Proteobacteria bacterium]